MAHAAYIGNVTVRSESPYVLYGAARGLIGEFSTLAEAQHAADKDARDCRKVRGGSYSDAHVYEWDEDAGWQRAGVAEDEDED